MSAVTKHHQQRSVDEHGMCEAAEELLRTGHKTYKTCIIPIPYINNSADVLNI